MPVDWFKDLIGLAGVTVALGIPAFTAMFRLSNRMTLLEERYDQLRRDQDVDSKTRAEHATRLALLDERWARIEERMKQMMEAQERILSLLDSRGRN